MPRRLPTLALLPFRFWLPGVMILMAVVGGSAVYARRGVLADAFVERNSLGDLPVEATSLQRSLEYLLANAATEQTQQLLAEKRADPDVVTALLIDEHDQVTASASRSDLGQPLTASLRALAPYSGDLQLVEAVATARLRMVGQIRSDAERDLILAVYPVVFGMQPGELRPSRIGALILARDLRRMKAEERREAVRGIPLLAGFVVVVAGLVVVLAHFTIARRADTLVATARRLASGDADARARLDGRDELAAISQAFDAMADDIGRARQATHEGELRLRASEERFRLALDASPAGMLLIDERGLICLVNVSAEQLFGYASGSLLGQPVEQLLPEAMRASHGALRTEFQKDAHASRSGTGRQLTALRKDGSRVPVEIGLNPIRSDQGRFVLASVVDVTARLRAEEERTHLEAQLRQSQKMDALGTLAGGVAHDFNNILTVILGNVWVLQQQATNATVRQVADEIDKAGTRAKHLVHQILRFSRQEAEPAAVMQLATVVEEDFSLLRATIPAGVELVCELSPGCPPILADRTSIHQVLVNLCTNAWHAMEGGRGRITIKVEAVTVSDEEGRGHLQLNPGPYVRLTVSDTGKGMDAVTRERIFDPFFTTKPVGKGTGLGLSVVHGVVAHLRGRIHVRSEVGRGSDFELYLPAFISEAPQRAAEGKGAAPLPTASGQHVLYVDDEESLIRLAERALTRQGYRFTGATDPDVALALVAEAATTFDVVVSDLNMPSRSGLELAVAVRRMRPGLPVIITSGLISDDLRAKAAVAGVTTLLPKPYKGDDLHLAIARELQAAASADGTAN